MILDAISGNSRAESRVGCASSKPHLPRKSRHFRPPPATVVDMHTTIMVLVATLARDLPRPRVATPGIPRPPPACGSSEAGQTTAVAPDARPLVLGHPFPRLAALARGVGYRKTDAPRYNTRDPPNPRQCPSFELVNLTGRRSSGFHQGRRSVYRGEKAGYMTASSTAAPNRFSPCDTGGVHTCQSRRQSWRIRI